MLREKHIKRMTTEDYKSCLLKWNISSTQNESKIKYISLSDSPSPPTPPIGIPPYSGHGLPNFFPQFCLFRDTDFQFRIWSTDIASFCTLSSHPLRGLPTGLLPPKLPSAILLGCDILPSLQRDQPNNQAINHQNLCHHHHLLFLQ